jgi:hypothetical protein
MRLNGSGGSYSKCPEGPQQLVCVDVIDLGIVDGKFGPKPKVRLVFQTADVDETSGRPYRVSKQYSNSLNEKATLRKDIESWLGKKLTTDQARDGIDPEGLIGMNAYGNIVHSEDGEWANLNSLMPLPRGTAPITAIDYTRVKDRPEVRETQEASPF